MIGRQKTYSVQLTEQEKRLLQQQAMPAAGCPYARKTGQSTRLTYKNCIGSIIRGKTRFFRASEVSPQ